MTVSGEGTVPLGRVLGIPVSMGWSVLVVLWLVAWGAGRSVLPETAPGYAVAEYWGAGLVVAVLLLLSLLCHEVAHAVTARRAGLEVEGLTLWLFGGVAALRGEPRRPQDDLRIATAGPLTSLVLALGLSALASALVGTAPQLAVASLAWLGVVNLLLGVFNLLPGAPLDGGRVLRALLWWRSGDRRAAELRATRAGRATAGVLIAIGLLEVLLGAVVGGVWLVLVAWFIGAAATEEEQQARLLQALEGLRVADVMSAPAVVLPDRLPVAALVGGRPPWRDHSAYPVVAGDGRPTGLLLLGRLPPVSAADGLTVADLARPLAELAVARPDEPLVAALGRLHAQDAGRLLVLREGEVAGIVTPADLLRAAHARGLSPGPPWGAAEG